MRPEASEVSLLKPQAKTKEAAANATASSRCRLEGEADHYFFFAAFFLVAFFFAAFFLAIVVLLTETVVRAVATGLNAALTTTSIPFRLANHDEPVLMTASNSVC